MNSQDYKAIRYQRWAKARAHDDEMCEKCFVAGRNSNDIDNWWEEREEIDFSGKEVVRRYLLPPKPYSDHYFRYFLSRIVKHNFTQIVPFLHNDFPAGDEVDRDYIEALLTDAEDLGLSTDGAVVIVDESGEACYPPPSPAEPDDFRGMDSSDIFHGGPSFQRRANMVREWCQNRANDEAAITTERSSNEPVKKTEKKIQAKEELAAGSKTDFTEIARNKTARPSPSPPSIDEEIDSQLLLVDLCAGDDTKQQQKIAETLTLAWNHVCNTPVLKTGKLIAPNTAASAVFKVAEHLQKVRNVSGSRWMKALKGAWKIEVTEALSKYSIGSSHPIVFAEAVKMAFEYFRSSHPLWVKDNALPSIYR